MANPIQGTVKPGFEAIADVFARGFDDKPEMGAALHIRHVGETIVDLWGGVADARSGRKWTQDTPTIVFSCTKGLQSILAARLVQEGKLDYDLPVAHYWLSLPRQAKTPSPLDKPFRIRLDFLHLGKISVKLILSIGSGLLACWRRKSHSGPSRVAPISTML